VQERQTYPRVVSTSPPRSLASTLQWVWLDRASGIYALFAVAIIAYLPLVGRAFISDDYIQISLARRFGPVSGWADLASDALYRCRATSLVLSYWVDRLFGLTPVAHGITSLVLHLANVSLVLAFGSWKRIGWRLSIPAAAFFGVYEGHQEAVVWTAALPELLVFFFSAATLLLWLRWLAEPARPWALAASLACFVLALLSKESAVVVAPLMFLSAWIEKRLNRKVLGILAMVAAVCVLYAWGIFRAGQSHLHLGDGTFSWKASVWLTMPNTIGRMLWIWGLFSLITLACLRLRGEGRRTARRMVLSCLAVMAIALGPYSFLTYMDRVPSRHTYLAAAALSMIVALAWVELGRRWPRRPGLLAAVTLVVALHNAGYLWIKKIPQYERRSAPTEKLLEFGRQQRSPIAVRCFPYGVEVAEEAFALQPGAMPPVVKRGQPIPAGAVDYCDTSRP